MGSSSDHAELSCKQKGTKRRALREGDALAARTVCPIPIVHSYTTAFLRSPGDPHFTSMVKGPSFMRSMSSPITSRTL